MTIRSSILPTWTKGQNLTGGAASANVECGKGNKSLVVTNFDSTDSVWIRIGTGSTLAATLTDYVILPRSKETIAKAQDDDRVAYIAPSGAPAFNIIPGEGQ